MVFALAKSFRCYFELDEASSKFFAGRMMAMNFLSGTTAIITTEAGNFDDFSLDVVQVLEQLNEYQISTKSIAQLHDAATARYYPNGPPNKAMDAEGYNLLLSLRATAIKRDRDKYTNMLNAYNNNNSKLRSMALGQCDKGIQAIIKAHKVYSTNQYDLFWILKRIILTS